MLIVRSPLRISLGGGGTDIPVYFKKKGSFFISAAINKYVYISINKIPENHYFIRYSINEKKNNIHEIEHKLIRETLKFYNLKPGVEITSFADLPSGTGLGSSGSFLTCLILALDLYTGQSRSKLEIAKLASHIEIDILKEPVGYQDTLISAIGGITSFEISQKGDINYNSNFLDKEFKKTLFNSLFLIDTNKRRSASTEIKKTIHSKIMELDTLKNLDKVKKAGYESKSILESKDLKNFGNMLTEQWKLKLSRSNSKFHNEVNLQISKFNEEFSLGSKLIGAGGGGYIMAAIPKSNISKAEKYLNLINKKLIPIKLDLKGTKEY